MFFGKKILYLYEFHDDTKYSCNTESSDTESSDSEYSDTEYSDTKYSCMIDDPVGYFNTFYAMAKETCADLNATVITPKTIAELLAYRNKGVNEQSRKRTIKNVP